MEKPETAQKSPEDWREISAVWEGGNIFTGMNANGNQIKIVAGQGDGIGPMELLLLGLAGCTGIDVVDILAKQRKRLEKFELKVRGLRRLEHPRIYTDIEVKYELWGAGLDAASVEKAIRLSEEKYCSVSGMLGAVAKISSTYTLNKTSAE